jgi:hypothetical protein
MKLSGDGGTIAVVALVVVVALSGCAGWGADGPAEETIADENGPETTAEEAEDRDEGSDDSTGEDGSDESDEPSETDPPNADEATDADEETETAGTNENDENDETEGAEPSDVEEDDADEDEAIDPADDDGEDTDDADDGAGADANDGTDASEEDDGEESDEADEADESDDPGQEYDAQEFTFVEIAYEDAEERPPNSVELLNTHDRSIDLDGWAITTTEGGEYVFPPNAEVGSDDAIAVQFESGELTRDGGTLALVDARGNVVVEDEYGD